MESNPDFPQNPAEKLSLEELVSPNRCLSESRPFYQRTDYDSSEAYEQSLAVAKTALPQTESAYKPSGKTNPVAIALLLIATPIMSGIILYICWHLCVWYGGLSGDLHTSNSRGANRFFGWASLIVDVILVAVLGIVPFFTFSSLSRLTKNRNPWLPSLLTGISIFAIAVVLFFPIWNGETLAPTDLTFFFIPIRWLLILIGGIITPLFAALLVFGGIASQKFCEKGNVFLEETRVLDLDLDFAENALELLKRGEYEAVAQLPKATGGRHPEHAAHVTLWWHNSAETAFLELESKFQGKFKDDKDTKEKTENWLSFSVLLDRDRAKSISQAWLTTA